MRAMLAGMIVAGLVVSWTAARAAENASPKEGIPSEDDASTMRIDCYQEPGAYQQACEARGCIWKPTSMAGAPYCYYDPAKMAGYDVIRQEPHLNGIFLQLQRRPTPQIYQLPAGILNVWINYETTKQLSLQITNPLRSGSDLDEIAEGAQNVSRILKAIRRGGRPQSHAELDASQLQYSVNIVRSPFGIQIFRKGASSPFFDTSGIPGFSFEPQYQSITTRVVSNIYGFGEQTHANLKRDMNWKKWSAFARDQPVTGVSGLNLYGTHPFYMGVEASGMAHGVVFHNTHAQKVQLAPYPTVTYTSIGGDLEFQFFVGASPMEVNQLYVQEIGLPVMPPYWSLGFHLCRYGYTGSDNIQNVIRRNRALGIPYDTQWVDIDYMFNRRDFTVDLSHFAALPSISSQLHSYGMKFVTILDPAIAYGVQNYQPLDLGNQDNAFILDARTGQPLQGKVWPGPTYFPDFTAPQTLAYWKTLLQNWFAQVSYDGLWIDMNEPSNFVDGSATGCQNNKWNNPPLVPLPWGTAPIYQKTICMDAKQYWGRHYSVHNLYGYSEAIQTRTALMQLFPNKRPFVLSRSTFIGAGAWTAHWTGDNQADWPQLKYSVITILEMQMFGIPMVGADICGFNEDAQEEMCTRWMQLGAFYPFMRNHNSINKRPQDPAIWSSSAQASMKAATLLRYKFLPSLYTLYYYATTTGSPVLQPMFYQWATDANAMGIADQFMWGSMLMVAPVMSQGATSRSVYFPAANWYDYNNGGKRMGSATTGTSVTVQADLMTIPLFVKGGAIMPWQSPGVTTVASRANAMGVLAALDGSYAASGSLYWDDGETLGAAAAGHYLLLKLQVIATGSGGYMNMVPVHNGYRGGDSLRIATVQIMGMKSRPSKVQVGVTSLPSSQIAFNSNNMMVLSGLSIPLSSSSGFPQQIKWSF